MPRSLALFKSFDFIFLKWLSSRINTDDINGSVRWLQSNLWKVIRVMLSSSASCGIVLGSSYKCMSR